MSTLAPEQPRACEVTFDANEMIVHLEDGRVLRVPLEWFPSLRDATARERSTWRLVGRGIGIHWPKLDEDVSVRALLMPVRALTEDRKKAS